MSCLCVTMESICGALSFYACKPLTITRCYLGAALVTSARNVRAWQGRIVPSMGFPILGMEYIFGGKSLFFLYLLPLCILFNAKFVGKDPLKETVGTRTYAIGSGSYTEQGNGEFQGN